MTTPPSGSRNDRRRTSPTHLLWGGPAGLVIGMAAFVVSFFAWCGTERCAVLDPGRFVTETVIALIVTAVGSGIGGAVVLLTPWTARRAWRIALAGIVATIPIGVAVSYIARFTQTG